jgi:DNA-binding LytR/AlgR family response regulator
MKLRCIIVDDEPMARKGIEEDIREIGFIEITGIAENSLQALELTGKLNPDLILLDIQMPRLNGLDFLKSLKHPPMIIIITAYSEHALEGYSLDVIDYLVKPVPFDRLLKACNKAREFYEMKQAAAAGAAGKEYFFIKSDNKYEKILLSELLYIEAADNYVLIHTTAKSFITYLTLKSIEGYLYGNDFVKVHKSFIVAVDKIDHIEGNEITIQKKKVPIGRQMKDEVMEKIVNRKLIKR